MADTIKTEPADKVEVTKGQPYSFPKAGITIEAKNLQEAQEKFAKTLKENKESDNG